MFKPREDNDRNALAALDQALTDWGRACGEADFAQSVPLAVARSAWLEALKTPRLEQRFRAGGVTFCTLMPMRAIPFKDGGRPSISSQWSSVPVGACLRSERGHGQWCRFCPPVNVPARVQRVEYVENHV
jgi:hypothetical protein